MRRNNRNNNDDYCCEIIVVMLVIMFFTFSFGYGLGEENSHPNLVYCEEKLCISYKELKYRELKELFYEFIEKARENLHGREDLDIGVPKLESSIFYCDNLKNKCVSLQQLSDIHNFTRRATHALF